MSLLDGSGERWTRCGTQLPSVRDDALCSGGGGVGSPRADDLPPCARRCGTQVAPPPRSAVRPGLALSRITELQQCVAKNAAPCADGIQQQQQQSTIPALPSAPCTAQSEHWSSAQATKLWAKTERVPTAGGTLPSASQGPPPPAWNDKYLQLFPPLRKQSFSSAVHVTRVGTATEGTHRQHRGEQQQQQQQQYATTTAQHTSLPPPVLLAPLPALQETFGGCMQGLRGARPPLVPAKGALDVSLPPLAACNSNSTAAAAAELRRAGDEAKDAAVPDGGELCARCRTFSVILPRARLTCYKPSCPVSQQSVSLKKHKKHRTVKAPPQPPVQEDETEVSAPPSPILPEL